MTLFDKMPECPSCKSKKGYDWGEHEKSHLATCLNCGEKSTEDELRNPVLVGSGSLTDKEMAEIYGGVYTRDPKLLPTAEEMRQAGMGTPHKDHDIGAFLILTFLLDLGPLTRPLVVPYISEAAHQRYERDRWYRRHAMEIGRMGLRMARARDISAEYEYHACVDGVLLCDYPGWYSIRSMDSDMKVSDNAECPKCVAAAKEEEA